MRRVRNDIFEQESYRGTGGRAMQNVTLALTICSVLSGLATIAIISNFGMVTAQIAVFMAKLLSSGFLILTAAIMIIYFIVRLKWKLFRTFWGG